ncbi:MAG: alpha/beta fold hydrolase [Planctomycetes bacterium]|nr:alpha/beta fold hydrolase [Planctomycetota bacterium]
MRILLALCLAYLVGLVCGMPAAMPFDYLGNLGFTPMREDLRVPADGRRRVVVLQHGILRSSFALGRLERALRDHGYEVHNLDYPSTMATLDAHADRLAAAVASLQIRSGADDISFVGHSMGGLVIEEYLRRPGAVKPAACVYIATPHRGAILADLRKHWFLYGLIMGTKAAGELSPGDAFHRRPIPYLERTGLIVGDIGDGNASIPGPDDGTVAVGEASLPGVASVTLPFGHTRIAFDPVTAVQVLTFLRHGRFEAVATDH